MIFLDNCIHSGLSVNFLKHSYFTISRIVCYYGDAFCKQSPISFISFFVALRFISCSFCFAVPCLCVLKTPSPCSQNHSILRLAHHSMVSKHRLCSSNSSHSNVDLTLVEGPNYYPIVQIYFIGRVLISLEF